MTFIASSGDSGAAAGAEWPSSSPNVVAVGGTTLRITTAGAYSGETIWSGSGSGTSRYESEPAYQRSLQTSGSRTTPDVAFDADPNTGVAVYTTDPATGSGVWEQVGGTSLGAPAWAGLIAVVDQGRALPGKGTLDGPSQTLPALYGLPATDFHKIASVVVSGGRGKPGTVSTAGLGTPNGPQFINDLAFGVGQTSASAGSVKVASAAATTPSTTTALASAAATGTGTGTSTTGRTPVTTTGTGARNRGLAWSPPAGSGRAASWKSLARSRPAVTTTAAEALATLPPSLVGADVFDLALSQVA